MFIKPVDEMSMRHLFSEGPSAKALQIEYWSPVINPLGKVEPNPDCIILDKRKQPYTRKTCEFKFIPKSADEFIRNGHFEIAIIWDLPKGLNQELFKQKLRDQNHCNEVIILSDLSFFSSLPNSLSFDDINFTHLQNLNKILLDRDPDVIFTAYLIAKAYPRLVDSGKLTAILKDKFARFMHIKPQGISNSISRFTQMKIPPIEHQYKNFYRWNNVYEPKASIQLMERLFTQRFLMDIPGEEIIEKIVMTE